jgi:hypothetical protein
MIEYAFSQRISLASHLYGAELGVHVRRVVLIVPQWWGICGCKALLQVRRWHGSPCSQDNKVKFRR